MRKLLAIIVLIPALLLLGLSQAIDPEPGAEVLTAAFRKVTEEAGLKLTEK